MKAETYERAAKAVAEAIALNAEQYRAQGSGARKALLSPHDFHMEVMRVAQLMDVDTVFNIPAGIAR